MKPVSPLFFDLRDVVILIGDHVPLIRFLIDIKGRIVRRMNVKVKRIYFKIVVWMSRYRCCQDTRALDRSYVCCSLSCTQDWRWGAILRIYVQDRKTLPFYIRLQEWCRGCPASWSCSICRSMRTSPLISKRPFGFSSDNGTKRDERPAAMITAFRTPVWF